MYKVLIVDDETIILSGIKFLIDWEKNDCAIPDTARNGLDALEKVRAQQPDIVLCDINMPVMNGIELLKLVNQEFPAIVFLMLTNLQEFQLVKDALHYNAADYLLKNQLDATSLEESLAKAKEECQKRSKLLQADKLNYYDAKKHQELLQNACMELLFSPDAAAHTHARAILKENHMLEGYGLLYIPFDFSTLPNAGQLTNEGKSRLTAWESELVFRLAGSLFGSSYLCVPTGQNDCLTLFIWGQRLSWQEHVRLFSTKLTAASENITLLKPVVCATSCFPDSKALEECKTAYFRCVESFYLNLESDATALENLVFEPLGLTGIGSQLMAELNSRNLTGCLLLLDKAIGRLQETVHQKSQAIWLCNELYRSLSETLSSEEPDFGGYSEIKTLMTRSQVIHWLEKLKNTLSQFLWQQSSLKSEPVEKARQYVKDHIEERITLQDVADEVCISAGYLSTLFKKQYNQSFISFVNQVKVERACELIMQRKYLISEISYRLGFENAYYFTKVFRRYTGMTPSDWEKQKN